MKGKRMPVTSKETEEMESGDTIELQEHRAMVYMPEDAVEVTIEAKVYLYGGLHTVSKTMSMAEIREAFRKADEGYIDDDDEFTVTEKGKAFLEGLR